jgi:hypothetical protein
LILTSSADIIFTSVSFEMNARHRFAVIIVFDGSRA